MKKRTVFLDTLPVMTGYLFLGIGFGILLNEAGYGISWAFSMSLFTYAGSLQFLAVSLLSTQATLLSTALATLLNYSVVPVVVDNDLTVPAFYDSRNMELAIQPNFPDNEAFTAIATEIAQARFHNKGSNTAYNREECALDAESVSYILCRRFGIDRDTPDLSNLGELYEGWDAQDVRAALTSIQEMSKQIGGAIERDTAPKQHGRGSVRRPAR